ncbi:hypothetical protein ACA29_13720 [Lederbergia galactosidilytica]|uniref:Uncharacterized protein n=1 Tax=Lederbergia galactosidilytica TaxID=217031 RepID=A0A0Q9Y3R6_9BACI|nr:hypothetical protein ACA29_13720 [Lederbergia galactosidilytica]
MDLIESILIGVIATVIVGSGITYKIIINRKNRGVIQKEGNNQVALQSSKSNSINIDIGEDPVDKENRDNPR